MRLWYGQTGDIGVAPDHHQMAKWPLIFALNGEVSQTVRPLNNTEHDSHHSRHTEDAEGRIKTDQSDHQNLRDTIDVCIEPLGYGSHSDGALMNIVTGQIAHPYVNADNAVNLGHRAMENFKDAWPD